MSAIPTRPLETALHVRVAEALGWSQIGPGNSMNMGDPGIGYPPVNALVGRKEPIPRFDIDWSATGPLIEKYGIGTEPTPWKGGPDEWTATIYLPVKQDPASVMRATARGLLPAVCTLILALKEAGKL